MEISQESESTQLEDMDMDIWIKLIQAMLNRGACWQDTNAQRTRCTLY